MAPHASEVTDLWPLLLVSDIDHSVEFYRDQLGFEVVGEARNGDALFWCRVQRGRACLMLQQSDGGSSLKADSVSFYFICRDADAIYAELTSRGLNLSPPSVAYYGMKQLELTDPDGYSICFENPTSQEER